MQLLPQHTSICATTFNQRNRSHCGVVFAVSKLIEASNPVTFITTVQYAQLKNYLGNAANKPAADGVYYIEVTGLTNTDLESSSWDLLMVTACKD